MTRCRRAGALLEQVILAPADDHEQATHLAGLAGARWGVIEHPLDAAAALDRLLEAARPTASALAPRRRRSGTVHGRCAPG